MLNEQETIAKKKSRQQIHNITWTFTSEKNSLQK